MLVILAFGQSAIAQNGRWSTTEWVANCVGNTKPCEANAQGLPSEVGIDTLLTQLREASRFLQAAGLREPAIKKSKPDTLGAPFVAQFQGVSFAMDNGDLAAGYFRQDTNELFVDYSTYFAYGTETSDFMGTATHELFHAVQSSYGTLSLFQPFGDDGAWVTEGSAEAVEWLQSGSDQVLGGGEPYLDFPLYDLRSTSIGLEEYAAYPFWVYLAQTYGSSVSGGVGVFHDLFSGFSKFPSDSTMMEIVNGSLKQFSDGGFYDLYPAFIAGYGFDDARYWKLRSNRSPSRLLIHRREIGDANIQITGTAQPIAAEPYVITVADVPNSELEIRLVGPDTLGLHLVVDDQRYDTPETGFNGERNVFFTHEIGNSKPGRYGNEFLVRVVNAPRDLDQYHPSDFRLITTLFSEYAIISDTEVSGPSSADIDSPIDIEMDKRSAFLAPYVTEDTMAAGFSQPCALRIHLWNTQTKDSAGFELDHDGALTAGDYPLASFGGQAASAAPEDYPGQVIAGFVLGENNAFSQGFRQQYSSQGGVLTIDQITPRWIEGSIRIAGMRVLQGDWTSTGWIDFPAELRNVEIKVQFSLRHKRPMGVDKHLDVNQCVETDPVTLRRGPSPAPVPDTDPKLELDPDPEIDDSTPPEFNETPVEQPDLNKPVASQDETTTPPPRSPEQNSGATLPVIEPQLVIRLRGDTTGDFTLTNEDMNISARCDANNLSIGFTANEGNNGALRSFGFRAERGLTAGELGEIVIPEIFAEIQPNGTTESEINFLGGSGILSISAHTTNPPSLRAALNAKVANLGGLGDQESSIKADFTWPIACD